MLRGTSTSELATRYRGLLTDATSSLSATAALQHFRELFSTPKAIGVEMAVRAVGVLADADEIRASCTLLANDFIREIDKRPG